jgi:hypothetical protein
MFEAACKANGLVAALAGENRDRVEEKQKNCKRAPGDSGASEEIFHGLETSDVLGQGRLCFQFATRKYPEPQTSLIKWGCYAIPKNKIH